MVAMIGGLDLNCGDIIFERAFHIVRPICESRILATKTLRHEEIKIYFSWCLCAFVAIVIFVRAFHRVLLFLLQFSPMKIFLIAFFR